MVGVAGVARVVGAAGVAGVEKFVGEWKVS